MTLSSPISRDVAIIGAGPVGLFTVFQCGRFNLTAQLIDTLPYAGGQCQALYPEKPIYDIPGFPVVSGNALVENLCQQIKPFNPLFHLDQQVRTIFPVDNQWCIQTSQQTLFSKAIVIAAGAGSFGPNRPPLEGLENFEEKSVFYHIENPSFFEGKKVVIAGGGDSAVDWALVLARKACVTVVHRRSQFRASPQTQQELHRHHQEGLLSIKTPFQLKGLEGKNGRLERVILSGIKGGEEAIEADYLLPFFGLKVDLGPIKTWGLDIKLSGVCVDPATCATNVPGVYAVGDVALYPGKQKLILCGFSEASMCIKALRDYLFPHQPFHFQHSTTQGVQGFFS